MSSIAEAEVETEEQAGADQEFYERELASFIPDRVFDAHTHLWHADHAPARLKGMPATMGAEEYRCLMEGLHPGRRLGALFIPWSVREKIADGNEWVGRHTASDSSFRGQFFVRPQDDPEWVRREVRRLGLHGLKCYHTLADLEWTWEAEIPDYLPENLMKVADEEGWPITLHIVKWRAAADAGNIHWIRHYCETYPNMKLILAHSARGFQPSHNIEGLPHLTGLDNLYFDSSANCEAVAHEAIIRIMGHDKLMYGSDLPVSHLRGRSMAADDSFLWLHDSAPIWGEGGRAVRPALVGHEHLRSLKWACWTTQLSDNQVEDIFWNNAARVFGLN